MFRDILVGIMAVGALIVGIAAFVMENRKAPKSNEAPESATDRSAQK